MTSACFPVPVTAAIRDISVDAEKQSIAEESQYRGVLETAMVVVNQGGDIVLLNLQAEKQFGYRRDELVGPLVATNSPAKQLRAHFATSANRARAAR